MAQITLGGNPTQTTGNLPKIGEKAPDFTLVGSDLSESKVSVLQGKKVILNIFPSVDTGTCATSVRKFNEKAAGLDNTEVWCISMDLPFAQNRFCAAEGIDNVKTFSAFRNDQFGKQFGVQIADGPFAGLFARAIVVLDERGVVKHTQLVAEIGDEPDYESALKAI